MDAGKLNERVGLFSLAEREAGDGYYWKKTGEVWASVTETGKQNLYSRAGLGERGLKIILRRRDMTLHNALVWRGKHCFLTNIREQESRYLEIEAALVPIGVWTAKQSRTVKGDDGFTRVVPDTAVSFPAAFTEKYLSSAEEKAGFASRLRYVLITPKAIRLAAGQVVEQDGKGYRVMICHTLDEYKNEYEVEREEDH